MFISNSYLQFAVQSIRDGKVSRHGVGKDAVECCHAGRDLARK